MYAELVQILIPAVRKLEAQEHKAMDRETGVCKYLDEATGCRCLYGHAITYPQHYKGAIDEDMVLDDFARTNGLTKAQIKPLADELFELQHIHDSHWEPGMTFKEAMEKSRFNKNLAHQLYEAL